MEPRERIADVLRRPGVYGLRGFDQAAAFFAGFDAALEWELLDGFREWLAAETGSGTNLAWPALALRLQPEMAGKLAPSDQLVAVEDPQMAALFAALKRFLTL